MNPVIAWPMGYCSSACRPAMTNAGTGLNSDCPGGAATCTDPDPTTMMGSCLTFCTMSAQCRTGYSCFVASSMGVVETEGCEPTAISQCDPRVRGSCPAMAGMPQTCVNVGDGTVGECVPSCNGFSNTGCMAGQACYLSDVTGEGLCTPATGAQGGAGATCGNFFQDCKGGYGCNNHHCYKYCNTGNAAVQCSQGATCMPFAAINPLTGQMLSVSIAGICSMSN
jgi:hypothetical protein